MNLLIKYIIALTNLYGMVKKDLLVEIYNSQNTEGISMEEVEKYLQNPPAQLEESFVYPYNDYFVHEVIVEFDEFDLWLRRKNNKPNYVPNKKELLKYVDDLYVKKTLQYKNLFNYFRKTFPTLSRDKIEEIVLEIHDTCSFEFNMQSIFDCLNRNDIVFEDEEQLNEILPLIIDLSNNTRLWENNGFTPAEISKLKENPKLNPSLGKPHINKREKIGRNDPCPCGSGKKYKKCCLVKE